MNLREKLLASVARSVDLYKKGAETLPTDAKAIGEAMVLLNQAVAQLDKKGTSKAGRLPRPEQDLSMRLRPRQCVRPDGRTPWPVSLTLRGGV